MPVAQLDRSDQLEFLNKILLLSGLPPVGSVDNLVGDGALALELFKLNIKQAQSRGWYLFNKQDRVKVPLEAAYTGTGLYIAINDAVTATVSPCLPGDPPLSDIVLRVGGTNTWEVRPLQDDVTSLKEGDEIFVDIIWYRDFSQLPEVFLNYCVYLTIEQFAPMVGGVVQKDLVARAYEELLYDESQVTPVYNSFQYSNQR